MSREYRHMKQYEKELLELKEKGLTVREIGDYHMKKHMVFSSDTIDSNEK